MTGKKPLYLSRDQVREIDRRSIEEYHIPGIVLMENASRGAADVVWDYAASPEVRTGRPAGAPHLLILCGGGNNGGDGLAMARHLHNRGASVSIGLCCDPAAYKGDALTNWKIVRAMKLPTFDATPEAVRGFREVDVIIDAIFGTGLTRPPRDPFPALVAVITATGKPVISVDVPSGLDCDTGLPLGGHALRAKITATFVAPKMGFLPHAAPYTGRVEVLPIGCPRELVADFAKSDETLPQT